MPSTLTGCIANEQGTSWEPFPWGDPEQAYVNEAYRADLTLQLLAVESFAGGVVTSRYSSLGGDRP
jgi:hypothetical protein